jgi:hypothetical protein
LDFLVKDFGRQKDGLEKQKSGWEKVISGLKTDCFGKGVAEAGVRDQRSEKRWLGFVVSHVRKSGHGAPNFIGRT